MTAKYFSYSKELHVRGQIYHNVEDPLLYIEENTSLNNLIRFGIIDSIKIEEVNDKPDTINGVTLIKRELKYGKG